MLRSQIYMHKMSEEIRELRIGLLLECNPKNGALKSRRSLKWKIWVLFWGLMLELLLVIYSLIALHYATYTMYPHVTFLIMDHPSYNYVARIRQWRAVLIRHWYGSDMYPPSIPYVTDMPSFDFSPPRNCCTGSSHQFAMAAASSRDAGERTIQQIISDLVMFISCMIACIVLN